MAKRSKFFVVLEKTKNPEEKESTSILEMHERLVKCTKKLLDLAENQGLSQIILTKHLGDVLAALIQLSSAPMKKPAENAESQTAANNKVSLI